MDINLNTFMDIPEGVYSILDGDMLEEQFFGTKLECAKWLFVHSYRNPWYSEFRIETIAETEQRIVDYRANTELVENTIFELPEHLKMQLWSWKINGISGGILWKYQSENV